MPPYSLPHLHPFLAVALPTLLALLVGAALLHLLSRLGPPGKALAAACCRAPGLDLIITYFTAAPLIVGPIVAGWWGLLGGLVAQVATVMIWTVAHEAAHRDVLRGPRIVHALNRSVGRFRNHAAVWWTALAVPVFFITRVAQYIVYPPLTWLVRLPRYNAAEWVNVSRQKFQGLVGHDLIWCLYCDWMTGVWSLGTEMLRNVESFWCPIRFDSEKKCANCAIDFPDVFGGWVPANASITDAAALIDRQYPPDQPVNAWFGHPVRLTHEGQAVQPPAPASSSPRGR